MRLISAKKSEPEWLLAWRLKAYRRFLELLAEDREPTWAMVDYPKIDYQDMYYYAAPKQSGRSSRASTRSTPSCCAPTRSSASRSSSRSALGRASPSTRCSTASPSPRPTRRSSRSTASCSARSRRRCSSCPELVQKWLGSVVPYSDNFFATLNSAVFSDGSFVYVPKGVRCPMELSTYFRINASRDRPVRAHPDRRRRRRLRELPRGLHGADARREPAPRRGGRARRARRRRDQVLDGAELVPGRQGRQGRHLQLRHQARPLPRQALEDLLDAGRDRLGDHLEVPELHPAGRRLDRRVLLGGAHQQPPAGGHRHEDDPHREEHPEHDRLEGDRRRARPPGLPRAGEDRAQGRRRAQPLAAATRC